MLTTGSKFQNFFKFLFKLNKTSLKNKRNGVWDKASRKRFIKQRNVTKLTIILIGEYILAMTKNKNIFTFI
jgi:hypothetical protein